ncbi:MAG: hypothetical protein H6708_29640 [Kofleriaceae bacterium]|nr:hypothetical protein [Kofleriaceae bacterium]
MEATTPSRPTRPRILLQPAIIRVYKVLGIAALAAILVGLIVFLTVNVFYFFNDSWVRPQILSPQHEKVIAAVADEAEAKIQRSQLDSERDAAQAEVAALDREITSAEKFEADAAEVATGPIKTAEDALARRAYDQSVSDRLAAVDRKAALTERISTLDTRIAEQDELIARMRRSPFLAAAEGTVVVAFVPYDNLDRVRPGVSLYGCKWGLVRCSEVGKVLTLLPGEVSDFHPHDRTPERGVYAEIELHDPHDAELGVLFAGRRPFWVF